MIKEFEITDILNAMSTISKIDRKKDEIKQTKKISTSKDDVLGLNKQEKSEESKILVLDEMIE